MVVGCTPPASLSTSSVEVLNPLFDIPRPPTVTPSLPTPPQIEHYLLPLHLPLANLPPPLPQFPYDILRNTYWDLSRTNYAHGDTSVAARDSAAGSLVASRVIFSLLNTSSTGRLTTTHPEDRIDAENSFLAVHNLIYLAVILKNRRAMKMGRSRCCFRRLRIVDRLSAVVAAALMPRPLVVWWTDGWQRLCGGGLARRLAGSVPAGRSELER